MSKKKSTKLMRVDNLFFEEVRRRANSSGISSVKLTQLLAVKLKKKKEKEFLDFKWDFRL